MNELSAKSREAAGECVVMKFGGTSVADAPAIRRVCQLVQKASLQLPVVVVSALAKVTDQLMNVGWSAAERRLDFAREILQLLRQRHETMARGLAAVLVSGDDCTRLCNELAREFKTLENLASAIAAEKAFTPASQDQLLGVGEAVSSRLVHAALRWTGANAVLVDARACIVTDAAHTRATPLWEETNQCLQTVLVPLLKAG